MRGGFHGGLSQREVAARVGVGTGAAVSYQLKRLESALGRDPELACRVEHMEGVLGGFRQKNESR